jgi:hypothetical protein
LSGYELPAISKWHNVGSKLPKMTKLHYKNIAITFLISTIWCVYVFFDYYGDKSFMPGLTLMFDFFSAAIFTIGIAALNIILRFTSLRNKDAEKFKDNFFYIFAGFSNMILAIIYFIYIITSHNIKEFFAFENNDIFFILTNLIIGSIIIIDIYFPSFKKI